MNSNRVPIKVVDGVRFFAEDRYWGKASEEKLAKAIKVIEKKGWDEFRTSYPDTFDATFEENRADWRFVVPLFEEATVLDIGAGMGRISIPLARVVKKIVAVDNSFLRVKFLKLRAAKENLENIEVCVADIFDLPFEQESFDLIVMNGVLEWVGATDRYQNPRDAQIASLEVCRRLLKPGGHLYIGIENRFALAYLRAVDHSGLRFTSYLPRWLADFYLKLRKSKRYDTYTYTKRGYEKLLQQAGFSSHEFYLAYPGYNLPRLMIPHGNLSAFAYAVKTFLPAGGWKRKVARLLARSSALLRVYRYFFFSFGIVVKK